MSTAALEPRTEMQALLHQIAGSAGYVKVRIGRAAKALGWPTSRVRDLWYADPRCRVDHPELLQARAVASSFTRVPVEQDLAQLRDLEAEVAALSASISAALERVEGAAPAEARGQGTGPRDEARRSAEGQGLPPRPLAPGAVGALTEVLRRHL